jgi:hypothetical protein
MHLEMREKNIEKTTQIINTTEREKEKNQKKKNEGKERQYILVSSCGHYGLPNKPETQTYFLFMLGNVW